METLITLGIGKMELDWGKNSYISNHSTLFQKSDFEQNIPYYTIDNDEKIIIKYKKGAKKKLKYIKERLDLLGYDLKKIEKIYNDSISTYRVFINNNKTIINFKMFKKFLTSIDIQNVNNIISISKDIENGYDPGEFFIKGILGDSELHTKMFNNIKNHKRIIGEFFESLHPYIILRLLAENEANLELYVIWRYREIINNHYIKKDEIFQSLEDKDKILIVTEGTTDSFILRRTLDVLYPHISDFFKFIDMKENYPFTGVGSLKNFCNGLIKIAIQNNIIVIFDNDTTGIEIFNSFKNIRKPYNLFICHLPNSISFKKFKTIGPFGSQINNINGKAVSIECFLDLSKLNSEPIIRWKNYNEQMKEYQGALENKDKYTQIFKNANLLDNSYNCTKLKYLINYIIKMWINR